MADSCGCALTKKDFESDQEVRWCPGCGDFAILAAVQRLMPELGIPRERHVFISGIGCSSRFPYYMNTYGFHTIHGRAPGVATGVKLANPDLTVWVITGDGDALSIGGNHFIHALRRNVDINVLLFNNQIYGLTKGQFSPTSELGKVTKSSPQGSIDPPLNPISLALTAGASFVARGVDNDPKRMVELLRRAVEHKGTSVIEILQNCMVFNDGAHSHVSDRKVRAERLLWLEHDEELVFGEDKDKVIALAPSGLMVKSVKKDRKDSKRFYHNEKSRALAHLLSTTSYPEFPMLMGVFLEDERQCYEKAVYSQIESARSEKGDDLMDLLRGDDNWEVE